MKLRNNVYKCYRKVKCHFTESNCNWEIKDKKERTNQTQKEWVGKHSRRLKWFRIKEEVKEIQESLEIL